MNKVVEILMKRDNISQDIAEGIVRETRDEIIVLEDPSEAGDIINEYLNLEPDYLFEVLNMN